MSPKTELGKFSICPHTNAHGNTSFDVSNTEIGPRFLVDVGFDGEKNVRNHRRIGHPIAQTTPLIRSKPKLARVVVGLYTR
jgi:hypothetical protein